MQCERVVVRDWAGNPAVARVWRDLGEVVEVATDQVIARLSNGDKSTPPVGFRRADVFRYDRELATNGEWSKGKPFERGEAT
jgi:hypothetical protein